MKSILPVLLLFTATIVNVGCSNDEDDVIVSKEAKEFLNEEVKKGSFNEIRNRDTLIVINNALEFAESYRGTQPLPWIDWEQYTLFIAQVFTGLPVLEKLELKKEGEDSFVIAYTSNRLPKGYGYIATMFNHHGWLVTHKISGDVVLNLIEHKYPGYP